MEIFANKVFTTKGFFSYLYDNMWQHFDKLTKVFIDRNFITKKKNLSGETANIFTSSWKILPTENFACSFYHKNFFLFMEYLTFTQKDSA